MVKHIAFAGIIVHFDAEEGTPEHVLAGMARAQFMSEYRAGDLDEYEVGVSDIQLHPDVEAVA